MGSKISRDELWGILDELGRPGSPARGLINHVASQPAIATSMLAREARRACAIVLADNNADDRLKAAARGWLDSHPGAKRLPVRDGGKADVHVACGVSTELFRQIERAVGRGNRSDWMRAAMIEKLEREAE